MALLERCVRAPCRQTCRVRSPFRNGLFSAPSPRPAAALERHPPPCGPTGYMTHCVPIKLEFRSKRICLSSKPMGTSVCGRVRETRNGEGRGSRGVDGGLGQIRQVTGTVVRHPGEDATEQHRPGRAGRDVGELIESDNVYRAAQGSPRRIWRPGFRGWSADAWPDISLLVGFRDGDASCVMKSQSQRLSIEKRHFY